MKQYIDLNLLAYKKEGFSEEEAGDILLDICVFLDEKLDTTATGTVRTLGDDDL